MTVLVDDTTNGGMIRVVGPVTGEVHAEHALVAPGEVSIDDAHYDRPRPDTPARAPRPRTQQEKALLALGSSSSGPDNAITEAFLTGAAAAGVSKLGTEIGIILDLAAAHGEAAVVAALERAVEFGRWRAGDIRSILATHGRNGAAPIPRTAGAQLADGVVLTLPSVPTRSLDAYKIPTGRELEEGSS